MSWAIPVKTEWMESQKSHEPSMEYAKDIYRVASKKKNFIALEVGAAWGFSTLALLEAGAKHLTSVDPNVLVHAPEEAKANGYTNYVWTCQRSDAFWLENVDCFFDLIYIDGSHLYRDVVNDLYEAWKRLKPNGLLMIDDWDHPKNMVAEGEITEYGVSFACFEFWRDHLDSIIDVGIEGRVLWFQK